MRKIKFLLSAFLLVYFSQLNAQNGMASKPTTPSDRAAKVTDKLNQMLSLSTEQYQKTLAINITFFTKRDELREKIKQDPNATESSVRPQLTVLFRERRKEIATLLTTDQIELYKTWRKESREKLKERKSNEESISEEDIDAVEIM